VKIKLPSTNKEILELITKHLLENDVYIFLFSHISSCPAIVLPVDQIVKLCHVHGALALVDAAHSIGAIPINLKELDPDFWLSNCHKWLFTPKGTAVMYVKKEH